jgi:hypothetical protein
MNQTLPELIQSMKNAGMAPAVMRASLHLMGKWTDAEIDQALGVAGTAPAQAVPQAPSPQAVPSPVASATIPPQQPPVEMAATSTSPQATYVPPAFVPEPVAASVPATSIVAKKSHGLRIALCALVVLIAIGGGYAGFAKGIFGGSTYNSDNLLAALVTKSSEIHSATFAISVSANMGPRDSDAEPTEVSDASSTPSYSLGSFLPHDMKISGSISDTSDWSNKDVTDSKFNIALDGDMGDLTYKVNVDGIEKDGEVFVRVNNMPSLGFFDLSAFKGQWITFGTSTSPLGSVTGGESVKDSQAKLLDSFKKFAEISETNHLIEVTDSEKVTENGRKLTRYDIQFNKEALPAVYAALKEAYGDNIYLSTYLSDMDEPDYFTSDKFNRAFATFEKNTKISLYVDNSGYPAILEYKSRIIPPASAPTLGDRQLNLDIRLIISDINKSVDIEKPEGAKRSEEIFGGSTSITSTAVKTSNLDNFAMCVKDSGAKLYGATWAPHVQSQKEIFGSSATLLPYVECSNPDQTLNSICSAAGINSFPTWVFANGTKTSGELSLKEISVHTSCKLPQ